MKDKDKTRQQLLDELEVLRQRELQRTETIKRKNLESLGILAGGIAHDFNNLLTTLMGNISMARMLMHDGTKLNRTLERSVEISIRGVELAQKLMTFSEGGNPELTENSIYAVMEDTISSNFNESRARIANHIAPALPRLLCDAAQLKQVFCNIIQNAFQAMDQEGKVLIEAQTVSLTADSPMSPEPGDYVKITLTDNGQGIPKKNLDKIFDPYFTTCRDLNRHGVGLGLSICQSIIRKHNGYITVESEPGEGASVHVFMPVPAEKTGES